jgi:DNA replication and repair protein RecF
MLGAAWAVERRLRRKPILLLDEVTAELDERGRDRTFAVLQGSSWQVFAATAGGVAYEWPGSVWVIRQGEVMER